MTDYSIFYRRTIGVTRLTHELPKFDIFVSAYNSSERVKTVFAEVSAKKKIWLLHPEYCYSPLEEPTGHTSVRPESRLETTQVNALLEEIGDIGDLTICIDSTGFMRHVLVFLVAKLSRMNVAKVYFLYSEPISYAKQEDTPFSTTTSGSVRPVMGMLGSGANNGKDHLIIGVGYDHKLIGEVSSNKDDATVYPVFGFPSLGPDMYQQSAIRASESGDIAYDAKWITNRSFAPANDPFATAGVISEIVRGIDRSGQLANIYLSPLSTKAQTLGFAIYWICEGRQRNAVTMLLPECETYSRETSVGLKRLWLYEVELPSW